MGVRGAANAALAAALAAGAGAYGDLCKGFVRGLAVDDDGDVTADLHLAHLAGAGIWRQGPDDYLYVLALGRCVSGGTGSGTFWRVEPAG
jgi:hypothetical protein